VVIANGSRLSKHIYAGSQRIVSKLCASGSSPSNPLTIAKAAEGVVNYTAKYTALKASVAARYDSLGLPFLGTDHAGSGFWTSTPTTRETDQYFYHPDHLGSSSLITTLGGSLAQHLEYLPFGEVFVDERATPTTRSTPYKFNAKELDEETGLYYYSARYMDPRLSLWLSVDPLAEKYPGVGSYVYCYNNPVKFVDPDGRAIRIPSGASGRESALSLLHGTLTHSESKYVRANTNGFIDPILIQKGKVVMGDNVSGNYSDLLEIVNSDKIVDFSAPKNKTANDANGKQVPADMMAFPFADPVADEYNNYIPELQGGLGITLAPSTHQWTEQDKKQKMLLPSEQQYYSTNGNYQVQVNGRGLGNKNTFNQLVRTTAHEMYGHLLMMFRGKNALHTSRRDGIGANVELENQIQKRVNEAEQNFNNKW
jgi:RHS repeat-associated protein